MQEIRDVIETLQEKERHAALLAAAEEEVAEFHATRTETDRKQMRNARKRDRQRVPKLYEKMHAEKTAPLSRRQRIKGRKILNKLEKKTGLLQIKEPKS
jgi:hypothetical protein